jgi:hypothetical protein
MNFRSSGTKRYQRASDSHKKAPEYLYVLLLTPIWTLAVLISCSKLAIPQSDEISNFMTCMLGLRAQTLTLAGGGRLT